MTDPRDALRESLVQAWRRTPHWISGASVQQVRAYKKTYADMQKLINKSRATVAELTAAINQTNSIYQ